MICVPVHEQAVKTQAGGNQTTNLYQTDMMALLKMVMVFGFSLLYQEKCFVLSFLAQY